MTFRYRDKGSYLPMASRAYQENHDLFIRCLLGDGAVRIGDLGSVFPNPNIVHVRVLDVAQACGGGREDLSDEEGECGEESIAEGEDESDQGLRAGADQQESGESEVVTQDCRHCTYDL